VIPSFAEPVVRWRKAHGAEGKRPPLLVLLHGRGADEHDLFSLAPSIDAGFAIASIRAPLPTDEGRQPLPVR
jgi:phospholipase/carboxylesterase